jgi:hypothetical protein
LLEDGCPFWHIFSKFNSSTQNARGISWRTGRVDAIGFISVQLSSMVDSSPEKYLECSNKREELGKIDIRILGTKKYETRCEEEYVF